MSSLLTSDNSSTGNERLRYLTLKSKLINLFFMRGYTKLGYEPLWATMSHYEPLSATRVTKSHYESLWATMSHYDPKYWHYDPFVNRIQCHDPKKDKRSPFICLILSQKYLIWSQNLKMLFLKRNLALVCIRGCWLRIW